MNKRLMLFGVICNTVMIRSKLLFITFLLTIIQGFGQLPQSIIAQRIDPKPLDWKVSYSVKEAKVGEVVELIFTSKIPADQHMNVYNCGELSFEFKLKENSSYQLIGVPKPIGFKTKFEELFDCDVSEFYKKAEIHQKIKILKQDLLIAGGMDYQTCTEESCLPFKSKLNIPLLKVLPQSAFTDTNKIDTSHLETKTTQPESVKTDSIKDKPKDAEPKNDSDEQSLWALFLLGIGGGLIALITPCVFPMIPMTVAFFTKQKDKAKGRKMALFYGLSILLICLVLGLALAAIFGVAFANQLSTHWLPNIIFFLIFLIFGASFLGMFEIVLPSSFVNKIDQQGDRGGYIGIFFIAFTLVLVSFSCTVPIVGTVARLAAEGELIRPFFAMLGFGFMFALPFTLFAFFPQWLSSLPKSGGWLNSVKVVLGIVEIALALKFLSQADVVYHWRILDRDVFIAIWISLSIMLGLYFLGKIKFAHDSDLPYVSVPRFTFAFMTFAFVFYLIPGMWGAPLRLLSGVLPPMSTQDYVVLNGGTASEKSNDPVRFSNILHLPHGLNGYFYYPEALKAAKIAKKPIFVDFTGHACANCRKMEEYVWVKPEILKRLKEDFIILSLYIDERKELEKSEWITKPNGDILKKLGEQNFDLQDTKFKSAGQPYYYIIDSDQKILSVFHGYNPDVGKFAKFLDEGKRKFK